MLGSLPSNQSSDFHCLQPAARVFIFKSELYRVILLLEILKGLSILLMPANEPKTQRKLNQKSQSACHPLSRSTICSRPSTGLMSQHFLSQVQFLQATLAFLIFFNMPNILLPHSLQNMLVPLPEYSIPDILFSLPNQHLCWLLFTPNSTPIM